jgi:ribose-phosphate pyrophosphokinase
MYSNFHMSSYKGSLSNACLIAGRSNHELAKLISEKLRIPLINCCLDDFANRELRIEIHENIRSRDVFILQTGMSDDIHSTTEYIIKLIQQLSHLANTAAKTQDPDTIKYFNDCSSDVVNLVSSFNNMHSINDYIVELIGIVSACRRSSAGTITALIPYFPYCRSDKKDAPRVPIMSRDVADMLVNAGVTRIVSIDLHAGQLQGFANIGWDNLFCLNLFVEELHKTLFNGLNLDEINHKYVLVSPDVGGAKRIEAYAKKLKMNHVIMHKQRDHTKKSVITKTIIVGDVESIKNKTAIIIDDIIDTMGTMTAAANELTEHGAKNVIIIATHGIFSYPAFQRITECNAITQVIVTNTLPQIDNMKKCKKITCVDTSGLLAEVIKRLVESGSLSELFK